MDTKLICRAITALLLTLVSSVVWADLTTGFPPLSSTAGGPFDIINLASLDVDFSIPVFSRAGVGLPFGYRLSYDSLVWTQVNSSWQPEPNWGWRAPNEAVTGFVSANYIHEDCSLFATVYDDFTYHDPSGTSHILDYLYDVCDDTVIGTGLAKDGSGYLITNFNAANKTATVKSSSGVTISTSFVVNGSGQQPNSAGKLTDPNGNQIAISAAGVITDTLGWALSITGSPPAYPNCSSTVTYNYPAPSGTVRVTVSYKTYSVQTSFGVLGVHEFGPTSECLVNTVTMPDTTAYQFYYEGTGTGQPYTGSGSGPVTARIAEVVLPTEGVITYTYGSGNNIMADGSPSYMTRTVGGGTWTYKRQLNPAGGGNPQFTQTTVLDPASPANETDYNFNGIYETQMMAYQGSHSTGTILKTTRTCYNDQSNCDTAPLIKAPIWMKQYSDYLNSSGYGMHSLTQYDYDQYGLISYESDLDYATYFIFLRIIYTNYNHNSTLCAQLYICDHRDSDVVEDGSGHLIRKNLYYYDANGNTTEISHGVSGTTYLYQYYNYNTNGTLASATDPNGTVTTYNYNGGVCNSAFPTSVSLPGDSGTRLKTQYTYNCNGGVVTSVTDPNGAVTSTSYTDPYFWRPASTTDAMGYVTNYAYYPAINYAPPGQYAVGQIESVSTQNFSHATVDTLTTPDGYGRPWLVQKRQADNSPNFDTVQTWYDTSGRPLRVVRPFQAVGGQSWSGGITCGNIPSSQYLYDALNRYTDITDCTQIHTDYSYNLNDVKVTVSPAPAGENTKSRQYEYDALGRLKSVCEVTSALGSGPCAQNNAQTGFFTNYTHDPLGNLTYMTQNGQYRSFSYDHLSRLIQEYNPEISNYAGTNNNAGIINYTYDSDATCGASAGDEVKRVDPKGIVTCYTYDGLHRVTRINYSDGTQSKGFYYDSPELGLPLSNTAGRLTLAYTANGANWTSDEAFSYDARGDTTDFYEQDIYSPQYHVQQSYYPGGAIASLQGFTSGTTPFTHSFGFSLEGEGRPSGIWDNTLHGAIVMNNTMYNVAGQPTNVYLLGGQDNFTYDGNSGRMTQWQYIYSKTQTGNLNWNTNGTLGSLQITDTANAGNNQTCTYAYDDLARVLNDLCGSTWYESYGYDPQGNIWKAGKVVFQNGYNGLNHVRNFTYDNDGNVTNDQANTYSYDAEGRPITEDGIVTLFDAFGRAIDQNSGGKQIVYSPTGEKFAFTHYGTLQQYMVPMVAGMKAVYNGSGLQFYRHTDWQGTTWFDSTPSGTVYFDGAWGPYGEYYAGMGTSDRSFTGQTHDTIGDNYDFLFRQYSFNQGLWLTPDPAGSAAVDPTNPQTWNRYAYVGNAPLTNVDPHGLDFGDNSGGDGSSGDDTTASQEGLYVLGATFDENLLNNIINLPFPYQNLDLGSNPGGDGDGISLDPNDHPGATDIPLPDDDAPDGHTPQYPHPPVTPSAPPAITAQSWSSYCNRGGVFLCQQPPMGRKPTKPTKPKPTVSQCMAYLNLYLLMGGEFNAAALAKRGINPEVFAPGGPAENPGDAAGGVQSVAQQAAILSMCENQ